MTEMELLKECVASRHFLLTQIADLARENGDEDLATAWTWIRDNKKWPTLRVLPPLKGHTADRKLWGWTFSQYAQTLDNAARRSQSVVPYDLIDQEIMTTTPKHKTEEMCLAHLARKIAQLIKLNRIQTNDGIAV